MKKFFNLSSKMENTATGIGSMADESKALLNKNKFIENTQRVIGMTRKIVDRISENDKNIKSMYSDIPGLLETAGALLVSMGDDIHMKMINGFLDGLLIKKQRNDVEDDGVSIWMKIKERNDSILTNNLSIILPNNPFVPRIQYIYGANPSKRRYVNDAEIEVMWKLITALTHNVIKYVIFSQNQQYIHLIPSEMISEMRISLE